MKLVIDTNVILSALFSKNGASFRLLSFILSEYNKSHKLVVVSNTLILEYQSVLTRNENLDKINLNKNEIIKFIDDICLISYHQDINFIWRPFLKDAGDDMLLEVAFNSNANCIITYNKKDFIGVEDNFNIAILNPKEFLQNIGEI